MNWFELTLILSAVASSLILSLRHFGGRLNPFLLMLMVSAIGATSCYSYCLVNHVSLAISHNTLILAFLAGFFVCMLDLAFIFMFRYGAVVSLSVPIYRVLSILVSASVGIAFFQEALSPLRMLGIVIACIAVYLLNCKTKTKVYEGQNT